MRMPLKRWNYANGTPENDSPDHFPDAWQRKKITCSTGTQPELRLCATRCKYILVQSSAKFKGHFT